MVEIGSLGGCLVNGVMNNRQKTYVITELKAVQTMLNGFLQRGREICYGHMKQVSHGVWINQDFKDLSECMQFVKSVTLGD